MAGLRRCTHPDEPHDVDDPLEMFCPNCGHTVGMLEEVENLPVGASPLAVDACPPPAPLSVGSRGTIAPTMLQTPQIEVVITFPWGDERVSEQLAVGRDEVFSPLADRLAAYNAVSRIHAEFRVRAGQLVVTHLSNTNPTYVDGREIPRDVEVALEDGMRVGFSKQIQCSVRIDTW